MGAIIVYSDEHLNRALVVERELAEEKGYEPVSAIPIRKAGGAMATYAFSQMKNPELVIRLVAR